MVFELQPQTISTVDGLVKVLSNTLVLGFLGFGLHCARNAWLAPPNSNDRAVQRLLAIVLIFSSLFVMALPTIERGLGRLAGAPPLPRLNGPQPN